MEFVLPVDVLVGRRVPRPEDQGPGRPRDRRRGRHPGRPGWAWTSARRRRKLYAAKLADAATVFWNGPMGVFEHPDFAEGTQAVAQALLDSPAFTVVGGGDSAAAVRILGFDENAFGHISTGGGASLEYLEGKTLPGLAALED